MAIRLTFLWEWFPKFIWECRWKSILEFLRCFKTFSVNCSRIFFINSFEASYGNSFKISLEVLHNINAGISFGNLFWFFFLNNTSENSLDKLHWKYFHQFLWQFLRKFPLECARNSPMRVGISSIIFKTTLVILVEFVND